MSKALLKEAEAARHELAMGTRAVKITRDGKQVEFQQSSMGELDRYITKLKGSRSAIRLPL